MILKHDGWEQCCEWQWGGSFAPATTSVASSQQCWSGNGKCILAHWANNNVILHDIVCCLHRWIQDWYGILVSAVTTIFADKAHRGYCHKIFAKPLNLKFLSVRISNQTGFHQKGILPFQFFALIILTRHHSCVWKSCWRRDHALLHRILRFSRRGINMCGWLTLNMCGCLTLKMLNC